jgi:hypothetical protein
MFSYQDIMEADILNANDFCNAFVQNQFLVFGQHEVSH